MEDVCHSGFNVTGKKQHMGNQVKRIKPYKALSPVETVKQIRSVLGAVGLQFAERTRSNNFRFSSSILNMTNPENGKVVFSTRGKGLSSEWASASAWGEMIERIQNLAFFMILLYPVIPESEGIKKSYFYFFPDEKVFNIEENVRSSFIKIYKKLTGTVKDLSAFGKHVIGVPFYDVFSKKTAYIPFRSLQINVGSNGMCSGNTREEALIQGISEVYERLVMKSLYLNPLCPPDIPMSFFQGTEIYGRMKMLMNRYGLSVQIKDCSMRKRYPVVGVLLKTKSNSYAFHLGADPNPVTALERCFSEMFQNGAVRFLPIAELNDNIPYDLESKYWKKNFSLTIQSYSGQWPPHILNSKPDYEFEGFDHPVSVSDDQDLTYLFDLLKNNNKKLYIRDNSFLGHPSYYIYIPDLSEITSCPDNQFLMANLKMDSNLSTLFNIKTSNREKLIELKNSLHDLNVTSPVGEFRMNYLFGFYPSHPLAVLDTNEWLKLIDCLTGDTPYSIQDIPNIMNSKFLSGELKTHGNNSSAIDIIKKMEIPACFSCGECRFIKDCHFPYISKIWDDIKNIMKNNQLNQHLF